MKAPSKFRAWFRAQHGPRPGGSVTDESLQDAIDKGLHAQSIQRQREIYDRQMQSALYAWNTVQGSPVT